MTLWWIGNAVLLLVVLPVVVYLLRGVLDAARSIVPSVQEIAQGRGRGVEGPRRRRAAADDAGPGRPDGRRGRELRRLPRRDPRRRARRSDDAVLAIAAAGAVTIVAVVLIVLALVYYLVS